MVGDVPMERIESTDPRYCCPTCRAEGSQAWKITDWKIVVLSPRSDSAQVAIHRRRICRACNTPRETLEIDRDTYRDTMHTNQRLTQALREHERSRRIS